MYNQEDKDKELISEEARRVKFRLLGPLSQGHNIVVYIRRSSTCTECFRKLAGRMILIDNHTR